MCNPAQDWLRFRGTVMQGPTPLSGNPLRKRTLGCDTVSVVGFKYIKKSLEDTLFAFAAPTVCEKSCFFPRNQGSHGSTHNCLSPSFFSRL